MGNQTALTDYRVRFKCDFGSNKEQNFELGVLSLVRSSTKISRSTTNDADGQTASPTHPLTPFSSEPFRAFALGDY